MSGSIPLNFVQNELKSMLRNNIVELTFDKINGDRRIMECTLLPKYLPDKINKTIDSDLLTATENNHYLAVWDLKSEGWRSFRFDRVVSYKIKD